LFVHMPEQISFGDLQAEDPNRVQQVQLHDSVDESVEADA